MPQYDTKLVGKRIAHGGDRSVFMYGSNQVLKISDISFVFGKRWHQKLARDYALCKKYLPKYVVETTDVTSEGAAHAELQPYIQGEWLSRKHMSDPKVRAQLQEVQQAVVQMKQEGLSPVDLVGIGGIFRPYLSNIIVDADHNLQIIDAALLEAKSIGTFGYVLNFFAPLAQMRQDRLLANLLSS